MLLNIKVENIFKLYAYKYNFLFSRILYAIEYKRTKVLIALWPFFQSVHPDYMIY